MKAIQGLPIVVDAAVPKAVPPLALLGVRQDSRSVEPGDLFVAIRGEHHDGRRYARRAAERGAAAVLGEGEPPEGLTVPWLRATEDPRFLVGPISAAIYGHPEEELLTVGVTGTNGKSTVTHILRSILDAAGKPAGVLGNVGYGFRDLSFEGERTTPEASDLFRMLRAMRDAGAEAVAFEVSSHALELGRVAGAAFDLAVFTNLTRDHFDFHGDFETYFQAKRKLFDLLKPEGRAAVGVRDRWGRRLAAELEGRGVPVVTFGPGGSVQVEDAKVSAQGTRGVFVTEQGSIPFHSPLIGRFNVENLEAAAAGAVALGLPVEAIREGIGRQGPLTGRMDPVPAPPGSTVQAFVDFAHTDDALTAALNAVRPLASGPVILVFGCGGEKDKGKRPLMGRAAGELADLPIATSDNPRGEDPLAILAAVEDGLKESGNDSYRIIPDRRQAIREAIGSAPAGAVVLVAGKGHEEEQIIGDRVLHFSDRDEIAKALEARFGGTDVD